VTFEGIDGSGKSTQSRRLAERLDALWTHEPGATPLGKKLRKLLLGGHDADVSPRGEALLMLADRAEHVDKVIRPALEAGRDVVSDRFSASTLAYQGFGRGMEVAVLETMSSWAAGGLMPDLSVLLDMTPKDASKRRSAHRDRFEALGAEFHEAVRQGFLELAQLHPDSWLVIDGRGDEASVARAIYDGVMTRLGNQQ
jgi:dTMP kinase